MSKSIKDIPQVLIAEIEKLSNLGYGIAKIDGYVVFIEGGCPGDKAKIKITFAEPASFNILITNIN